MPACQLAPTHLWAAANTSAMVAPTRGVLLARVTAGNSRAKLTWRAGTQAVGRWRKRGRWGMRGGPACMAEEMEPTAVRCGWLATIAGGGGGARVAGVRAGAGSWLSRHVVPLASGRTRTNVVPERCPQQRRARHRHAGARPEKASH
eukprot:359270-Chlamydomonas_euryale.AAC.4